jgi:hypothetical protein
MVRTRWLGPKRRLRIDLHGVSTFGPGQDHTLIRWESVIEIRHSPTGVVVDSAERQVLLPAGVFGLAPVDLADRLDQARSIFKRGDIIEGLDRSSH